MFTGIIEAVGEVKAVRHGPKSAALEILSPTLMNGMKLGDSVAVNGVCLTAREIRSDGFAADVMAETLRRSSLGELKNGSYVNLERAMQLGCRFGGHIVAGHVDGTGVITGFKREDVAVWVTIKADRKVMRYIIEKGSVALDGVSLTVAEVLPDSFRVSLIPHTAKETTLLDKKVGSRINIENDMIGKYVERLLAFGRMEPDRNAGMQGLFGTVDDMQSGNTGSGGNMQPGNTGSGGLSLETLAENGFL